MLARPQLEKLREELWLNPAHEGSAWVFAADERFVPRKSHVHVELEYNLCLSGEGDYLTGGRRVRLRPGRILWLFPEEVHRLHRASADFAMWIAVFRPKLVKRTCCEPVNRPLRSLSRPVETQGYALLPPADVRALTRQLEDVARAEQNAQPDRLNALLPLLLLEAWERTQEAGQQRPDESALNPAVYRVAMRLYDDPTCESLADLASEAGLSSEHLSRLFSQQMGQSMSAYRSEQRLRRFAQLMAGDRFNLTEAALEAGFGSYAQCFRVLREQWGVSPSALKKRLRAGG